MVFDAAGGVDHRLGCFEREMDEILVRKRLDLCGQERCARFGALNEVVVEFPIDVAWHGGIVQRGRVCCLLAGAACVFTPSGVSWAMEIPRRTFLGGVAAAAACTLLSPAGAGVVRPKRALEKVGVGFIGMGMQNRYHINDYLKNDRVRVLAVCDVDTKRREHCKKQVDSHYGEAAGSGGCGAYTEYNDLLARADIDAVVIGTPDHWHALQVVAACKAGKDIYCEKPLTFTLEEGRLCIEAVRKYGRVLQTGSQQRTGYDGRFRIAAEYVRNGRLGPLYSIYCGVGVSSAWCDLGEEPMEPGLDWDRWLGPAPRRPYNAVLSPRGLHDFYPNWRLYREYSGGLLTDWGAHHFDIAQWMLDADGSGPVEVLPAPGEQATHGVRLRYSNGVEVVHGGPFGVLAVGERGSIYVDRDRISSEPASILKEALTEKDVRLPEVKDHHGNFLDCIESRARPVCDVEVGARSIAVAQLTNLAYWNRQRLAWDPASWQFVGPNAAQANLWRDYSRREGFALPTLG